MQRRKGGLHTVKAPHLGSPGSRETFVSIFCAVDREGSVFGAVENPLQLLFFSTGAIFSGYFLRPNITSLKAQKEHVNKHVNLLNFPFIAVRD